MKVSGGLKMNKSTAQNQMIHGLIGALLLLAFFQFAQRRNNTAIIQTPFTSVAQMVRLAHAQELLGTKTLNRVIPRQQNKNEFDQHLFKIVQTSLRGSNKLFGPKLTRAIQQEANRYHFDPFFLAAIIAGESSFNPYALGHYGEIGLMQIKPSTAKWIAKKMNIEYLGKESLRDPITNVQIGAAYLSYLRGKFNKKGALYIAAYNMGPTNVRRVLRRKRIPRDYPRHIMKRYLSFYKEIDAQQVKLASLTKI